jgi:uncharacterized repeat protein (TIGR01451 family)
MKKLTLLFLVLVLKFAPANAQWVTIPDPNFVTKLQQLFPSCMNGNQMNTACMEIVNASELNVSSCNISNLSGIEYFNNLFILICNNNSLTNLPELPSYLYVLDCTGNQLTSLPNLPNSLDYLFCSYNQLSSMPALPNSLSNLYCSNNQLNSLPTLPNELNVLDCNTNLLNNLPSFPIGLDFLDCSFNQIISLPITPSGLSNLNCSNNQLSSLPEFYYGLNNLICNNNQLNVLPNLPSSLSILRCFNNQLSSLPAVPISMIEFRINNNNISCLDNLPNIDTSSYGDISNNPLNCVPNQTNYSLGMPLCIYDDLINNPNNCLGVNIIGSVYTDLNSNCTYENTDLKIENVPIKLFDNLNNLISVCYTIDGVYSFFISLPGSYSVSLDDSSLPILISCGQSNSQIVSLASVNESTVGINFSVSCDTTNDVYVQSISRSGWVFPGQTHTMRTNITDNETWFNIACDEGNTSGLVTIQVNGPVSYVAPALGALTPTVSGNTFTYNISDFNTLNPTSFGLRFLTDTTAQVGDQICVHVEISPNPLDADTTNNVYDFCYNVVNSYDPNIKQVYPQNVLPGYDDWFTYTIYFQNTGNAPAFNIRLRDTLDTQLDLNTFEVLGYSHPANVTVSGNILTVRFNNIMLPDSTSDYEGSMGYFQYRLKPLPNLPNGSQIRNTCYIYFDYNAPIITNTTENNFDITVPVKSIVTTENSFSLFPNPSTGVFTFKDAKNIHRIEVYNLMGQEIAVFVGDNTNKVSKQINLSNQNKGIYFAKINGSVVLKLVKE